MDVVDGLASIFDNYDAFALDQWGVLHDGREVFPGVEEALLEMVNCDKEVLILTNSSKTRQRNVTRLETSFGLRAGTHYGDLVSSAQLVHDWLGMQLPKVHRVHVISAGEDAALVDDLDVQRVGLHDCDLVLLLSLPTERDDQWLVQLMSAGKSVVVPSADAASVTPRGLVAGLGPSVSALQRSGVDVRNFGKPSRLFYDASSQYWRHEPHRVLAVGDQLLTDVVGASSVGWATALVLTGAGELSRNDSASVRPDFILSSLRL